MKTTMTLLLCTLLFASCEKEGPGAFYISVYHNEADYIPFKFYLDGVLQGTINTEPYSTPDPIDCDNIYANFGSGILYITPYSGPHKWELQEERNGSWAVVSSGNYTIVADNCNKLIIR
jgi:hypothetical protein